jgi:hypothetical protein
MELPIDPDAVERSARRADYSDGLLELFAAVLMATLAGGWALQPGMVGLLSLPFVFFGWKVIAIIKERITYPRIGYSGYNPERQQVNAKGMLGFFALAAAIVTVMILLFGESSIPNELRRAAPLFSGIAFAGGFRYLAEKSGMVRHHLLVVASVVSGVAVWWRDDGDDYSGMPAFLLIMAVVLGIMGGVSLVSFLKRNPAHE